MPDPSETASGSWLEAQILRQMAQVKAPDTLWKRIETERRARRATPRTGWMLWPAVATILLFASGDLLWEIDKARGDVIRLSDREIAGLTSEDPAEISGWVKAKADMDVDLSCCHNPEVRLFGVRLLRVKDEIVAAISYQMHGKSATLLVSKKGVAIRRTEPNPPGGRLVSWNSRDRSFAIAWPHANEVSEAGNAASCLRCHVDGHGAL